METWTFILNKIEMLLDTLKINVYHLITGFMAYFVMLRFTPEPIKGLKGALKVAASVVSGMIVTGFGTPAVLTYKPILSEIIGEYPIAFGVGLFGMGIIEIGFIWLSKIKENPDYFLDFIKKLFKK